jgi:putative PIN family toxin of toxin-antitoxin system
VRAVLDANVLVAALLSKEGRPAQALQRWLAGEFELIVSPLLLAELRRALGYPKLRTRVSPDEAEAFVSLLEETAVVAADPPSPPARSEDVDDDYVIALAESSSALLVSGDRHMLALAPRLPVRTVAEFVEFLDETGAT